MARILIIDDDVQVRKLLQSLLVRAGYEVAVAADGKEGLEAYRQTPADLIITDLIMPEKEGIEMILELHQEFSGLKIIAISGGARIAPENYLRMAETLGACRTFSKPVDRNALLTAVAELLAEP
ncbi:MAG: response regulator [Desulfobacterales bacterium]|nr:response regulator [Desulfobacterales bacterium]